MRRLLPLLTTYFVDTFGLAIVYPLLTPLLLSSPFSLVDPTFSSAARLLMLSALIATFPFAQFFGAPLIGSLSDRIGRRRVLLLTISGTLIGYILCAVAIEFRLFSLLWIGRFWTGLFAGNLALCLAAVADVSRSPALRARHFGWIGAVGGPGFITAILIGGSFSSHPAWAFYLTALLAATNWIIVYRLFKETHPSHPSQPFNLLLGFRNVKSALRFKTVRPLYFSLFFFSMCWITTMQLLPSYVTVRLEGNLTQITFALLSSGICWLITNGLINPWLTQKAPPAALFSGGLSVLTLLLVLTLPMKIYPLFLPLFALSALVSALCWTNGLATISLNAPPSIQGSILGINQSVTACASIVGPLIGGLIISESIGYLFFFTAACAFAAAFLLRKRLRSYL